ncbi:hypothetical protein Tco_1210626 [Tanacetum coccineum]
MSDSDEPTVTYTEVSNPFEGLSDIGSPGVVGPEHEGLPWMLDDPYVQVALQIPPSPNYIPGPEEPQSPPLPDFVPEPVYPEYMPQEDEVFSAEEQPLSAAASPTAQSPDYVSESDPEEDLEDDDDEDPEEDLVDYPADGGDDDNDEDESSEDDEDDDVDIEADDDEEEEEHPAPADSTAVALPAADQALSAEETEPFETDESAATPPPHPAYRVTARISIPTLVPTPVWSDAEVARLLAISTPPLSPLSPWSSPLPQIPFPPLPRYHLHHYHYHHPYLYQLHHLLVLFVRTPPLHLLSTDRREDRPEVTLPPRKRLGIALGPRYEIGESSSAAVARPDGGLRIDYGFVATMDREIRQCSQRMTEFETRVRQDTDEVYMRLDDEQTERQLLAGRLNMLFRDRRAHAQVMSLRTIVLAQQSEIRELQLADRRRQTVITEMLAAYRRRQKQFTEALKLMKRLQNQMTELQRQQGPANGLAQPELPKEAGSSS